MSGCCSCADRCNCKDGTGQFQAVVLRDASSVYSPWIPRRGDYLRAIADLVARNSKSLTVKLFTKNLNETGDGVEVDGSTTIVLSAVGRKGAEWGSNTGTGIKELVRYQFSITPASIPPDATAFVAFRMLMPCWFDALKTTALP